MLIGSERDTPDLAKPMSMEANAHNQFPNPLFHVVYVKLS